MQEAIIIALACTAMVTTVLWVIKDAEARRLRSEVDRLKAELAETKRNASVRGAGGRFAKRGVA
jgi:hypothetical protein